MLLTGKLRFLRPWGFGGLVWLLVSLTVSLEHLRSTHPYYLFELSGLMTILWLEFCFAGIFHSLRKEHGRNAIAFLCIAVIPPALLFCINFILSW